MSGFFDQSLAMIQLTQDWFFAQSLPVQVLVGAAGLAFLWVCWIVLRVILVAFRAAFRGL